MGGDESITLKMIGITMEWKLNIQYYSECVTHLNNAKGELERSDRCVVVVIVGASEVGRVQE